MALKSAAFAHLLAQDKKFWTIEPIWKGETVFIVAGGPSVRGQNITALRGRNVITINTSYQLVPWADFLIFSDPGWWRYHGPRLARFSCRVVSLCQTVKNDFALTNMVWIKRRKPPCNLDDPSTLTVNWTTLTAAMEAAAHLGAARIVLLGADGKTQQNGKDKRGRPVFVTHHHDPHPWSLRADRHWKQQKDDLRTLVKPLKERGIEVLNASPGSALGDLWPIVSMESIL